MAPLLKEEAWLSPAEYLSREAASEFRNEYVGGRTYAMAGASRTHNIIAGNIFAALHGHLRGKKCRTFMNDMKLRLAYSNGQVVFYYPDIMVACRPEVSDTYVEHPSVIFEVLSRDTEDVDKREKFFSYTGAASLDAYVLVDQYRRKVLVYRRVGEGWDTETLEHRSDVLFLPTLEFNLGVEAIYEDAFEEPEAASA
jgi:Uma2 family endonuclease